jgi:hypothetical protein
VAKFMTRVELHDATYNDYLQLHGFMRQEGFTQTIRGDDGIVYQLPPPNITLRLLGPRSRRATRQVALRKGRRRPSPC